MPTKLSQWCDGIMEAAWLTAIVVVPVFFNVYSNRIFEPDKLSLLRSLALIVLVAWLVKIIDMGGPRWDVIQPGKSRLRAILDIPLVKPTLALAIVYIVSSLFSVSPGTSLWGSYQRLQGTYTTFSYLVIFASVAGNLRRRDQVQRLLTVVILTSLPVSLYGVLQRYQIDPVPWGGNVSSRIAANMGNSIFVAAYLIMAFPITIIRIVESFGAILNDEGNLIANFSRATSYVFICALQVIALYFSGSRGPWLGWAASLVFLGLLLSLIWRKRWLTIAGVSAAAVAALFLLIINVPNGPLDELRTLPGIGRLGQLLDAESRTGRVRTLIWQGTAELVLPHAPLTYPDGSTDRFNFLRPLIGYGPETMYVAYNPFYPPELTQVEKRNASPDRAHNETWDSVVITGLLGLAAYIYLFGAVIYYALKWLGLVPGEGQRNLFLGLYLVCGVISAVIFISWKGLGYFGVGLPFGMLIGVILYLVWAALFSRYESPNTSGDLLRALTLTGLLAVIVAHFAEINFGIAIAVTRSYFWTFSGLLLVCGNILPRSGEYGNLSAINPGGSDLDPKSEATSSKRYSKKRRSSKAIPSPIMVVWPVWFRESLVGSLVAGTLLATLGYNFISSSQGGRSAIDIIWTSMVLLRGTGSGISYGVLAMMMTTWLVAAVTFSSEGTQTSTGMAWVKSFLAIMGMSLVIGLGYWLWHASGLATIVNTQAMDIESIMGQIRGYEILLTKYYLYLFGLLLVGAGLYAASSRQVRAGRVGWRGAIAASMGFLLALATIGYTNVRIVQADIAYKLAEPFTRPNSWPIAIAVYDRAIQLAPNEDFYYLFLGRAYLEHAKTLTDSEERENLFAQAARDLKRAQELNPLNTDHTANLGRLYSLWASISDDPQVRLERAETSDRYFSQALTLSPNNARLWGEWAILYMNSLDQPDRAFQLLERALALDPYYDWIHAVMAEYYLIAGQDSTDPQVKAQAIQQIEYHYQEALRLAQDNRSRLDYNLALGQFYISTDQTDKAIQAVEAAISIAPDSRDIWKFEQTLAQLYAQKGDVNNALIHAQNALLTAPEDQKSNISNLIAQLNQFP